MYFKKIIISNSTSYRAKIEIMHSVFITNFIFFVDIYRYKEQINIKKICIFSLMFHVKHWAKIYKSII